MAATWRSLTDDMREMTTCPDIHSWGKVFNLFSLEMTSVAAPDKYPFAGSRSKFEIFSSDPEPDSYVVG